MDLKLKNKTVLVTGSTLGIGFATAKVFAQEGAKVFINGRDAQKVAQAVAKIEQTVPNAQVKGIVADLSDAKGADKIIQEITDLDILINNVGIFEPKAFAEISDADWTRFFEINVMSGVRLSRYYFPKMLAKNWGRIVFLASESGVHIPSEMVHYGMTKAAQIAIVKGMAELTKGTAVTVNAVLPGPTRSEGVEAFVKNLADSQGQDLATVEANFFKEARPASIIQRFIDVEEIANTVAFVASPLAGATNGASVRAEGGILKF
jgi:NAD(P)-dependent dehydrogenase (short-subunit alcohol dehydrogenase family)